MPEIDPKIAELEARLDSLVRTQIDFQTEISMIRRELTKLRAAGAPSSGTSAENWPPEWQAAPPPAAQEPDAARPEHPRTGPIPPAGDAYQPPSDTGDHAETPPPEAKPYHGS